MLGELNRRVTIVSYQKHKDQDNNLTYSPVPKREAWAKVEWLRGAERIQAMQTLAKVPLMFTVQWFQDLDQADGVRFENRYYDIVNIVEVGNRQYWEITAELRDDL